MKRWLVVLLFTSSVSISQIAPEDRDVIPMFNTYQKACKLGSVYYQSDTQIPFTAVLYGRYTI